MSFEGYITSLRCSRFVQVDRAAAGHWRKSGRIAAEKKACDVIVEDLDGGQTRHIKVAGFVGQNSGVAARWNAQAHIHDCAAVRREGGIAEYLGRATTREQESVAGLDLGCDPSRFIQLEIQLCSLSKGRANTGWNHLCGGTAGPVGSNPPERGIGSATDFIKVVDQSYLITSHKIHAG